MKKEQKKYTSSILTVFLDASSTVCITVSRSASTMFGVRAKPENNKDVQSTNKIVVEIAREKTKRCIEWESLWTCYFSGVPACDTKYHSKKKMSKQTNNETGGGLTKWEKERLKRISGWFLARGKAHLPLFTYFKGQQNKRPSDALRETRGLFDKFRKILSGTLHRKFERLKTIWSEGVCFVRCQAPRNQHNT